MENAPSGMVSRTGALTSLRRQGDCLLAMAPQAAVTVHVPSALRKYCAGAADLPVSAATVRAALDELERNHPSLYVNICDETGSVRRHLNVFVNSSHVRDLESWDTALAPGDVVTILAAVSGG